MLVVEARDRVGGRILNHELRDGSVIESGGAFVGPTQGHIKRLAKELGVKTFKEYVEGNNIYVKHTPAGATAIPYTGTIPPDPTILPDAGQLQERIDSMAAEIDVSAPWAHPNAEEWDSTSFDTWVREQTVNPDVRDLLLCYTQAAFGADGMDFSLLFLVWYIACVRRREATSAPSSGPPGTDERRAGRAASSAAPSSCRCGWPSSSATGWRSTPPVRRIRQDGSGVDVHTDRGTVRAKRVVVACPPRFVLDIDWSPLLPPRRAQLLQRMPMGALMKCDAVYETPFWREDGLSGSGLNTKGAVRTHVRQLPARRLGRRAAVVRRRLDLGQVRQHAAGQAPQGRPRGLRRDRRRQGARTRSSTSSTTGPTSAGPRAARSRSRCPGAIYELRRHDPRAVPPRALGGHRDLDVLGRLHGRRRPGRRARRPRGAGPAVRRADDEAAAARGRSSAVAAAASVARRPRPPRRAPDRERWDTRVFSKVPSPGFPAFVYAHPNGRLYGGTYTNPQGDSERVAGLRVDPRAAP